MRSRSPGTPTAPAPFHKRETQALRCRRAFEHRAQVLEHRIRRRRNAFPGSNWPTSMRLEIEQGGTSEQKNAGVGVQRFDHSGVGSSCVSSRSRERPIATIHPRADFVAHGGEEIALGATGGFGRVLGEGELFPSAARFQRDRVIEFLFALLLVGDVDVRADAAAICAIFRPRMPTHARHSQTPFAVRPRTMR